jgi:hypothetical protein
MRLPGTVVPVKGFTSGLRQGTIATAVVAGNPMASESENLIVRRIYRPSLYKTL